MADAKREHEYDVAIQHACFISQVFSNKFRPNESNPVRNERTTHLQEQQSDGRGAEGFALLGAGLRLIAAGLPNGNR